MHQYFLLFLAISSVMSLRLVHTGVSSDYLNQFRKAELAKHNEYRALHGSPNIQLSETLNAAAQTYAQSLAAAHKMSHSPAAQSGKYGENLYWGWGYPTLSYALGAASTSWYKQEQYYNYQTFKSNTAGKSVGHFTAMVWKSVTTVGFGYAVTSQKNGQAVYIVANYAPTPNMMGKYGQNVLPKK